MKQSKLQIGDEVTYVYFRDAYEQGHYNPSPMPFGDSGTVVQINNSDYLIEQKNGSREWVKSTHIRQHPDWVYKTLSD